ncbi:MAG TPA: prenyltransferase/squalene oxidase repeat-containing protein [Pirellulaceae bacterium]|jgi:squalene-hopene/tetraprenyl-beta-curcumene cyclase|nr:prenyltransferase/squalene oxidase repeat-containing protein [Pirellulaceae bacterium]
MTVAPETVDLAAAGRIVRQELLAEANDRGYFEGRLSSSALATATAVSALALFDRHASDADSEVRQLKLAGRSLVERATAWLSAQQNRDGGWGDCPDARSNISTAMLVRSAFAIAGLAEKHRAAMDRAEAFVQERGGTEGIRRRYGKDKTFAVPILTNGALAGLVDWKEVAPLPFEAACIPQRWYRFAKLPVVSYAVPALVAIGQAVFLNRPPANPLLRWIRQRSIEPSLSVLLRMQPASGGYLEAIPLTSFVAMSLAATGRADHPVTLAGIRFLHATFREEGTWPIDSDLATWNTTQAVVALGDVEGLANPKQTLDWILSCQHRERHPFTGADPGGWGWTNLSGAVPDADDTPAALLALKLFHESPRIEEADRKRIREAASAGLKWLADLQNRYGGWPTFCRGWTKLPFDRSGSDLTAHAIRAFHAWRDVLPETFLGAAIGRGWDYLRRTQRADGSWSPLWFGNQDRSDEENPIYGTAKVLLAYRDAGREQAPEAFRALRFLVGAQNSDGSWGGGESMRLAFRPDFLRQGEDPATPSDWPYVGSVEETALAVEALASFPRQEESASALRSGTAVLTELVATGRWRRTSPIGFYFARLWYDESLYPPILTASALRQALARSADTPAAIPSSVDGPNA